MSSVVCDLYRPGVGNEWESNPQNDVSGYPSPSFAAVICPGEPNMLSEPDAWTGTLAYNPVSKQYDPVHSSRYALLLLGRAQSH